MDTTAIAPPAGFSDVTLCGRGATSRVYRAIHAESRKPVALKRLHRHLIRSQDALGRLRRELDALTSLRHPGIVTVQDVMKWEGDPTLVMEFVDGEDLKERITRLGKLPHDETERIARALLDILAAAHAAGIVHRDLKPQNLRVTSDGALRLLDFGSARLDAAGQLTATGTTVGTPEYMAPELFAGSVYDPRVDLYGVGATLYECVTGRAPQTADSIAELAFQRSTVDVKPVRSVVADVPDALAQVIDRCLARAPEDRFPSAAAAVWALDHPLLERAFVARRSSHPPCIRCLQPIAPDSTVCPRCQRVKPFALSAGRSHVQLHAVENPARFLEWLAMMLPERSNPGQLLQMSEQLAALSFAEVRFASFIHHDDAAMLVEQLHTVGVRASVVHESGVTALGKAAAVMGFCAGSILVNPVTGIALALASLVVDRLIAFDASQQGMLAMRTWRHKHVWSALQQQLMRFSSLVALVGMAGMGRSWDDLAFHGAFALMLVSVAAGLTGTRAMRLHLSRSRGGLQTPEPPVGEKLRMAFAISPHPVRGLKVVTGKVRALVASFALVVGVTLVPAEMIALAGIEDWLRLRHAVPTVPVDQAPAPAPDTGSPTTPAQPRTITVKRADVLADLLGITPSLLVAGALVIMRRRTRKVRDDARVAYAELDMAQIDRLSRRKKPFSRHGRVVDSPAARIAQLRPADPFVASAVARAAEMAPLLPKESVLRLGSSLEVLARQKVPSLVENERSLLSRCILETDPEQKTRFEFLALEGQLYASAAVAWSEKLKERK